MPKLSEIHKRHAEYQDAMVAAFEHHLQDIVRKAQARTIAKLQAGLKITDGQIDATSGNMIQLRNAGKLFMRELEAAGYERLVNAYVGEFQGTLPFLQETVKYLGDQAGKDWTVDFTQKDLNLLAGVQANSVAALDAAMESVAGQAITRGLFGVAGLRFEKLVETLATRFDMAVSQARTVADTSMSVWYATASDLTYQEIEKDLPEQQIRYRYSGPDDKLTRPFCEHLLKVDKGYTREEIDRMDNGQLPNVMLTKGGWNCRHVFVVDVRHLENSTAEAA